MHNKKPKTTKSSYIPSGTNPFKWRHFSSDIILTCIRWYCKYALSYRDLEEMMIERGVEVNHSTIYRWIYRFSPELDKRINWYKGYKDSSWRVDETYIKVKGKWKYLYRAVGKNGNTIDFFLSHKRNSTSARRFFNKTLNRLKYYERPSVINTDKNPAYDSAIIDLRKDKKYSKDKNNRNRYFDSEEESSIYGNTEHRKIKYLSNIVESDHFRMKKPLKLIHGFKSFSSANRTIKGVESMLIIKKRQCTCMDYCNRDYAFKSYNYCNKLSTNSGESMDEIYQNMPKYVLTTRDKIVDEIKFINKLFDTELYIERNLKKKEFSYPVDEQSFPASRNDRIIEEWYKAKISERRETTDKVKRKERGRYADKGTGEQRIRGELCLKLDEDGDLKRENINLRKEG